jgi:hypothetical protein
MLHVAAPKSDSPSIKVIVLSRYEATVLSRDGNDEEAGISLSFGRCGCCPVVAWALARGAQQSVIYPAARVVVFIAVAFACSVALAAEPKRVMLLHSFGRDFKPWSEYAREIRTELVRQSPSALDITEHSLVTARSGNENPEIPFVHYLSALFAERPLDLIVSIGAPAAAFVQRHRHELFANTPMVFTAVDERRVQFSSLSDNDTVVAVRINYFAALENVLRVLPDTKNVTVVVGTSPIEKFGRTR